MNPSVIARINVGMTCGCACRDREMMKMHSSFKKGHRDGKTAGPPGDLGTAGFGNNSFNMHPMGGLLITFGQNSQTTTHIRNVCDMEGGHAATLGEQLKSSSKGEKRDTSTSHGEHESECTTTTDSESKKEIRLVFETF